MLLELIWYLSSNFIISDYLSTQDLIEVSFVNSGYNSGEIEKEL